MPDNLYWSLAAPTKDPDILALREEAKEALGENFDIREFNQVVLDVASTPQPLIEYTVRNWISASVAD